MQQKLSSSGSFYDSFKLKFRYLLPHPTISLILVKEWFLDQSVVYKIQYFYSGRLTLIGFMVTVCHIRSG